MRSGLLVGCALLLTVSAMAAPAAAECKWLATPPRNFDDEYDAVVVARLDKVDAEWPFAITVQVTKPLKGSFEVGNIFTAKQGSGGAICSDYPKVGHKVLVALKKVDGALVYGFVIDNESTRLEAYERSVEAHQRYLQSKSSCSSSPGPARAPAAVAAVALAAGAAFARRRRSP